MQLFRLWNLERLWEYNSALWYGFVEVVVDKIYDEQKLYNSYENKKSLGISKSELFKDHYSIEHLQFLLKELKIVKAKLQSVINLFELWDLHKRDSRYYNGYHKHWREYYESVYPNEYIRYSDEDIFRVQARAYEFFNECEIFAEEKTLSDLIVDDVSIPLCSSYEHLWLKDFENWIKYNDEYVDMFWNTIYQMDNNIFECSKELREIIAEIDYVLKNKKETHLDWRLSQINK
mgnify:CR=1 FL=1